MRVKALPDSGQKWQNHEAKDYHCDNLIINLKHTEREREMRVREREREREMRERERESERERETR